MNRRFLYVTLGTKQFVVGPFETPQLAELALEEHGYVRTAVNFWIRHGSFAGFESRASGWPVGVKIISPAEWDQTDPKTKKSR